MRNNLCAAFVLIALSFAATGRDSTPDEMWPQPNHDFGTVPRGAQLLHRIPWHNPQAQRVEISDLRVSCGCTMVTPHPRVLDPGQDGYLEVAMDARAFSGHKTVYVQILTSPGPKAATLVIQANSRQDLVCNPGQIRFGTVPPGANITQNVEIEYAGQLAFRIEGIDKAPEHIDAVVQESYRRPGQVGYRLIARLRESTPPGDLKEQIFLKTNDPSEPIIAVVVEATVRPSVTATPNPVNFGSTKVGKMVSRRLTLRHEKPFQIKSIEGGINVAPVLSPSSACVQTVLLQWTPTEAGEMKQELTINTDLPHTGEVKVGLSGLAK
jgi:hypothetical protein